MANERSLVRNAADEGQVKEAEHKEKRGREQQLGDLRTILAMPEGRRLMWRLIGHCKVNGSIWEPSARIHYNSGMQDVGHFLMAEVGSAGEEFLFKMMTENKGVKNG